MNEPTWKEFVTEYQKLVVEDAENALQRCSWELEDTQNAHILLQDAEKFWKDPISFSQGWNIFCKKKLVAQMKSDLKSNSTIWNEWIASSHNWTNPNHIYRSRLLAPRWNCFAQIALLHVQVEKNICVYSDTLSSYSDSWTLVFYNQNLKMIGYLGSKEGKKIQEISLPAGIYTIGYRCYTDDLHLYCPRVVVDQVTEIENMISQNEKKRAQKFLHDLRLNKNPLFFLQQYYIFYWLQNKHLTNCETHHEYLPVGNPDTSFKYGYVPKEMCVQLQISANVLEKFRFYVAIYNQMSIPIQWNQVTTSPWTSAPCNENATYLIRCAPRGRLEEQEDYAVAIVSK